ncbi:ribbon-helix-helix domain-containing protein [Rhodospirillaceae bacterium SYSU D60014]|uniref:ribbon-helix-helix domain-containing protein n=1 Tax=Virgifigura deserti TaxID=2268457 RepID=UPI000E666EB3
MKGAADRRLRKRSVLLAGHRTSLSLEAAFWDALKELATARGLSLNRLIEEIDRARSADAMPGNLSSAVRVFVLDAVRASASYTNSRKD